MEREHGLEKCFEVRDTHDDVAALRMLLDEEDFRELNFFAYENKKDAEKFLIAFRERLDLLAIYKNALEFIPLKPPMEQITENINDLKFAQAELTGEEFNRAMREMEFQMRMTDPMFATFKDSLEDMGKSVSDSLANMLVNGQVNLSSFLDIF